MMKKRMLALLLGACLVLSACAREQVIPPAVTLPPSDNPMAAPVGDAALSAREIFALYFPSADGRRLLCRYEEVAVNRGRHPAEAVIRTLLAFEGDGEALPLGHPVKLQLSGVSPVEVSGGVCTVNLSTSALQLEDSRFYAACLAIAATLCELKEITAVNVLSGGQAVALDVTDCLPLGSVTPHLSAELPVLWDQFHARRTPVGGDPAQTPLTMASTLYFPLADASGITPEIRTLSFEGQSPRQLTLGLLAALSAGPRQIQGASAMPDLLSLLTRDPEVHALAEGGKRLTLHFVPSLERSLRSMGLDTACWAAALTVTLTTCVPGVNSVQILTGDSALTSLYNPLLGSQLFEGGVMRRADFSAYLKQQTELCLPKGELLVPSLRAMTDESAWHPRSVLLELMNGPTPGEAAFGYSAVLPKGLTDADVLGFALRGDTLLMNLSARFAQAIRDSGMDQQLMARSLTVTLCRRTGARRLRVFFAGEAVESLGDDLVWSGEFLYSPSLMDEEGGA